MSINCWWQLLTMSMSFVAIAHFATVDAPANFWYWLSCLFAVLIWKRGEGLWYVLANGLQISATDSNSQLGFESLG